MYESMKSSSNTAPALRKSRSLFSSSSAWRSDTSAAIIVPAAAAATSYTENLTYDQLNRPVSVNWSPSPAQTTPSATSASFAFGYDATNRRINQTATDNSWWSYPAPATSISYTANNLNQYTTVGAVSPSYDGNGNLTYDGTFTYGYDAENRLISASGAGNTASYAYDAQGRRKSKTVNGTTTILVQDPQGRALLDYDGASGAIQSWYAFGSGPNDVLNQINVAGSTRTTYIPDVQGSIVASLDASSGTLTKAGIRPMARAVSRQARSAIPARASMPKPTGFTIFVPASIRRRS